MPCRRTHTAKLLAAWFRWKECSLTATRLTPCPPPCFRSVYTVVPSEDASVKWLRVSLAFGILDIYGGYYSQPPAIYSAPAAAPCPACGAGRGKGAEMAPAPPAASAAAAGEGADGAARGGAAAECDSADCGGVGSVSTEAAVDDAKAAVVAAAARAAAACGCSAHGTVSIPMGHGDLCDLPAAFLFPLGILNALGPAIRVPRDTPGVLRYRYGDR